jgi:hypothetical protein
MRQQLPPLEPFAVLVRSAFGAASRHVVAGSRRNAAGAISARTEEARDASTVLAALGPIGIAPVAARQRRSA